MKYHLRMESLEDRLPLTFTFSQFMVDLPLDADVGSVMEVVDLNDDSRIDLLVGSNSGNVMCSLETQMEALKLRRGYALELLCANSMSGV